MKDYLSQNKDINVYKITGYSVTSVQALLEYLYTEQLPPFGTNSFELLSLANICKIPR